MRIAIVGLGGVGGYIAASLADTTHEVVGFARGEHLQAIQKNGLTIIQDTTKTNIPLFVTTLNNANGIFDVVLFCVKSYDLKDSLLAMKNVIDSNTTLLSFSNGVSNAEVLKEYSDGVVLSGCIYILSHIQEAGVIRKKGKVFAAVFGGDEKHTQKLNEIFEEANLRVKTPTNIQEAIWKKYIFISAFATLTSYYNTSIGAIYEHHKEEAKALLEEIANVATQQGIDIIKEVEKSLQTASKVPYESSTSMYLDFKNKKQTELDTLSYYIIKEARKYNIEVPIMEKLYSKLYNRIN